MTFRPFTPETHQELAQLLIDCGDNSSVCIQHFTNEGYDPAVVSSRILSLTNLRAVVGKTKTVGTAAVPRNQHAPSPQFHDGVFTTPSGAKVLFELKDPNVVLYDNFLSAEECDHILSLVEGKFNRSLVVVGPDQDPVCADRSSQTAHLSTGHDETIRTIEARIAATVHWPVLKGESIQVTHYEVGQEYKPHYDFFADVGTMNYLADPHNQRTGTLIMYLNEPEAGGCTIFPHVGLRVPARRGQALFFSYPDPQNGTKTLHGGEPVIQGEKTIATKWFKTLVHGT